MPTSAQSAVRASARLSVDDSDCDREPARDNVIPCNVNDYRSSPPRAQSGYRDACRVDGDQLTFDHRLRRSAPIADVHPFAVETLVVRMLSQRSLGSWRGNLEVVRSLDEARVVERGLEKFLDRRYRPCRHVGGLGSHYRRGWSLRQTTSRGAALKIEL